MHAREPSRRIQVPESFRFCRSFDQWSHRYFPESSTGVETKPFPSCESYTLLTAYVSLQYSCTASQSWQDGAEKAQLTRGYQYVAGCIAAIWTLRSDLSNNERKSTCEQNSCYSLIGRSRLELQNSALHRMATPKCSYVPC